jgi:recombination protein RecT
MAEEKKTAVEVVNQTPATKFTNMVTRDFNASVGSPIQFTDYQKRLIQNYFISMDMALKSAEANRLKKDEKWRDKVPVNWNNVNLESLSQNVVAYSKIGLDPLQPNNLFLIPYKNNATQKYDITFMPGYRGLELKAKKYGFEVPDYVIVEVVHKNDVFKPIKRDKDHPIENYTFTASENPFERGEIVGGFYFHGYKDSPEMNKVVWFNMAEIEKRKPAYASPEFWGGEKDEYKNGTKTGKKVVVEGWLSEMVYKTVYRAAYNGITIDSQKIDDSFVKFLENDRQLEEHKEPEEQGLIPEANAENLNFTDAVIVEEPKPEAPVKEEPKPEVKEEVIPAKTDVPADGALFPDEKKTTPKEPAKPKF